VRGDGGAAFSKHFTWSERDEAWGIHCPCVGLSQVPPGSPYPLRPARIPGAHGALRVQGRTPEEHVLDKTDMGRLQEGRLSVKEIA
jgi:hypothetical protein